MDASEQGVDILAQTPLPEVEEDAPAVEAPEAVTANEEEAAVDATDTAVESHEEEADETPEAPEAEDEEGEGAVPGLSLASIRDEVGRALEAALAPFMPALAAMQANHQREVDDVRQRILGNARNTFTAAELEELDLSKLDKLAAMLDVAPADYAGRGQQANAGRRAEPVEDGPLPMPKTF